MIITSYRIIHKHNLENAFTGLGPKKYGGRWNSIGTPIIYTSENLSLSVLEILVHINDVETLNRYYYQFTVQFDAKYIQTVDKKHLPSNWNTYPSPAQLKKIGDQWAKNSNSLVLKVPSSIIKTEYNYLISPNHKAFKFLKISKATKIQFDERLYK